MMLGLLSIALWQRKKIVFVLEHAFKTKLQLHLLLPPKLPLFPFDFFVILIDCTPRILGSALTSQGLHPSESEMTKLQS
jgi:hypothetical protein